MVAAVLIPIAAVLAVALPSQAASTPAAGGVYTLVPGASGKCIEVPGTSTANGTLLTQAACVAGATRQQWQVVVSGSGYGLVNVGSGKCVDVPSGAVTSGLQLQQYSCGSPQTNREWSFTASAATPGKFRVTSVATNLCVSDQDGSTAGNNPIVQETCSDIARMQISFNYVTGSTQLPCDIYAAGGTPCVAAHSTTRALYAAYNGSLYQVRRASDNTTRNIAPLTPGGVANAAAQDSFCSGTTCVITVIYDQSGRGNHLTQAPAGHFTGPAAGGADNLANATAAPTTVNGQKAYGVYVVPGVGYRNDKTNGIATGDQPEGMYAIVDGTHYNGGCCFDYGNAETTGNDDGNGTMEAIYFGNSTNWGYGAGSGPWVMADFENGMFSGVNQHYNANDPSVSNRYLTAVIKGKANNWAIRAGNAQSGSLSTFYNGVRPNVSGYNPMKKEGAIILGTGGDNSIKAAGTFYEGVMTSGYPSDATENAVQANIVAAGYR